MLYDIKRKKRVTGSTEKPQKQKAHYSAILSGSAAEAYSLNRAQDG